MPALKANTSATPSPRRPRAAASTTKANRVPARDQAARRSQAQDLEGAHSAGTPLDHDFVLVVSADESSDSPETSRRDHESGDPGQTGVHRFDLCRPGEPECQGDEQNAPHVRQRGRQPQQQRLMETGLRSQCDGGDQRLAMPRLDRMSRTERQRQETEEDPRAARECRPAILKSGSCDAAAGPPT